MENVESLKVGIHYKTDRIRKLYQTAGVQEPGSSGFDLMNIDDVYLHPDCRFQVISLGIVVKLPLGYHAIMQPRSSTFKNWEIIETNSIGLFDESYCGINDIWRFASYYLGCDPRVIPAGTRIAQFIIEKRNPFEVESFNPGEISRGGFGSTGK